MSLYSVFITLIMLAAGSIASPILSHRDTAPYTGEGTFYTPSLGACGISNTEADLIVAVSDKYFQTYPGATDNPNLNPLCGKQLTANYSGKSVTATITDRCGGCALYDLDFSPAAFAQLADESLGRIYNITWSLV